MAMFFRDGASPETLRRYNRGLILRQVFEAGRISRTQVAAATGLTGAAVSRITRELLDLGLLEEGDSSGEQGRPGRRSVDLALAGDGAYVVGIGVGAFEQWARIANLRGEVVAERRLAFVAGTPEETVAHIAHEVDEMVDEAGLQRTRLFGVGVAVAGVVAPATGEVLSSPNLGWKALPLGEILSREFNLPVRVESMHHALNLAEAHLGQTRGVNDVLLVNAALGIGASILSDGRLVRGGHTAAGQIGHMPVADAHEICTCGRRGCLDTVASGHAVLTYLEAVPQREKPREHGPQDAVLLQQAIDRAADGDPRTAGAFAAAGKRLGEALAVVRAVTDPERVILAGPLARVPSFVAAVRKAMARCSTTEQRASIPVVSDQRIDAAGAWLALDAFVFREGQEFRQLRTVA